MVCAMESQEQAEAPGAAVDQRSSSCLKFSLYHFTGTLRCVDICCLKPSVMSSMASAHGQSRSVTYMRLCDCLAAHSVLFDALASLHPNVLPTAEILSGVAVTLL